MFLNAFRGRRLVFKVVRIMLLIWHNERNLFMSGKRYLPGVPGESGGPCFGLLEVLTRRDGRWDTRNCMRTLFALVRCCDTMLVDRVSAQVWSLAEKNGKEGWL